MGQRSRIRRMSDSFPSSNDSNTPTRNSLRKGPLIMIHKLMDHTPHTAFEDMPCTRLYPLFTRIGVTAICVVSHDGAFRGIITRQDLLRVQKAGILPESPYRSPISRYAEEPSSALVASLAGKLASSEEKNKTLTAEIKLLTERLATTAEAEQNSKILLADIGTLDIKELKKQLSTAGNGHTSSSGTVFKSSPVEEFDGNDLDAKSTCISHI